MTKKTAEFRMKALLILMLLSIVIAIPVAFYYLYALPQFNREKMKFERQRVEQYQAEVKEGRRLLEARNAKRESELNSCLRDAETNLSSRLWGDECETWKLQIGLNPLPGRSYIVDGNGRCLLPTNLADNVAKKIKEVKDECRKKFAPSC